MHLQVLPEPRKKSKMSQHVENKHPTYSELRPSGSMNWTYFETIKIIVVKSKNQDLRTKLPIFVHTNQGLSFLYLRNCTILDHDKAVRGEINGTVFRLFCTLLKLLCFADIFYMLKNRYLPGCIFWQKSIKNVIQVGSWVPHSYYRLQYF